jgi:hypothetical protein
MRRAIDRLTAGNAERDRAERGITRHPDFDLRRNFDVICRSGEAKQTIICS